MSGYPTLSIVKIDQWLQQIILDEVIPGRLPGGIRLELGLFQGQIGFR